MCLIVTPTRLIRIGVPRATAPIAALASVLSSTPRLQLAPATQRFRRAPIQHASEVAAR
jgi:hypothetical protein